MKINRLLPLLSGLALGAAVAGNAQAQCPATTFLFANRPANEDWKAHAALAAPTTSTITTISSGDYTSGASAISANAILHTQPLNGVQTLYWYNDYTLVGVVANRVSTITFTFNRPVSNLSIELQDVDAAFGFTDQVTFAGSSGGVGASVSLTKGPSSTVSIAGAVATGTTDVTTVAGGNVLAVFTGNVTALTLTYRNTSATSTAAESVGISEINWCQIAPIPVNVVNRSSIPSTAEPTSIDSPRAASESGIANFNVTQVPSASQGILSFDAGGARYVDATNGVQLSPAQATTLRFDPVNPYPGGNAVFKYTATDNEGLVSPAASFAIPVAAPLPVELASFSVEAVRAGVQLKWSTASEKNNNYFEVERSINGIEFVKIGQVTGQGNVSASAAYGFLDASNGLPVASLAYYRLRQVDTDGTKSYSLVRSVRLGASGFPMLGLYPNPASASEQTVVLDLRSLPRGTYQATLLDATGLVLATYATVGGETQEVSVRALAAGTYLIRVQGQGLHLTQRLTK